VSESLAKLLLRLSEAGAPAVLWGRQAQPHLGRAFDFLLTRNVLVEQAPATEWPVCAECDCGLDFRPITEIDGRSVACCPSDAGSDAVLDSNDRRGFHIDHARLAQEIALASGFEVEPSEVAPGVWSLGLISAGQAVFLAYTIGALQRPGLLTILRAAARGAPITLLTPTLRQAARQRFNDAGVHQVPSRDVVGVDEGSPLALDLSCLAPDAGIEPRLIIVQSIRRVTLDGVERALPEQPYRLLCRLAAQARNNGATVEIRDIEAHIWGAAIYEIAREARDVVRELRDSLAKGSADPKPIRALIESRRNPNGYRLALAPEDIDLRS